MHPALRLQLDGSAGSSPSVLCIGAHCDDIEIGCGATLHRWAREFPQLRFEWAIFAGEPGRKDETVAAAARIMAPSTNYGVRFLDFRGSYFPTQFGAIKEAMEALKQDCSPTVVFTHRLEDRHQDHHLLSELTWNSFRSHLILEYEIPKFEGDLGQPAFYVPVEASDLEQKVSALMECFPSQRHRSWFTAETFRGLARIRGIECVSPSGYAEAFTARKVIV